MRQDYGTSALIAAAGLVAGGAHAQIPPSPSELRIYAGLHAAAAKGDAEEIERLIGAGEKPNVQDAHSRTPLHVAAFGGHHAAARALLQRGAEPERVRRAALRRRYHRGGAERSRDAQARIASGANPRAITSPYDGTALIAAAHLGHAEIVRELIAAKAPLDHVNNLGWTALMESIVLGNGGKNHTATLEALVKAGANVNIADRQGVTPLGHARSRGYAEMVGILEAAGGR